ncbi:uncharacterized protein N0V96_008698 [Colletotrichum fioriniae]|uniref:uncharacterized protein n=1 Tax=Colletotrichum fioriniae TaxID=710243 RepID=UPI0032DA4CCD|nr:hypothetical protein N0V96_008698 [Colletotrichum fioriniae]
MRYSRNLRHMKAKDRRPRGASADAAPTPTQIVDAPTVWNALKEIHADGQAVGLVTILQEPSALMLGALHMTMRPYFDMTELLNHFITDHENNGKTTAHVHRAFAKDASPSHLRQRSFFFVFKYYTVTRRREGPQEGFLFDTFAPWHLLSIQSFPDDEHTLRGGDAEAHKNFPSGPYAFLDALVTEYRDATKRNLALHARIAKLITPPTDFMFDARLRDKLLFEDKHFTYIRRYFWAYNTLGVVNEGLRAMLAAYRETFPDDFWEGRHQTLWPHPAPESPEGAVYRDKMVLLRSDLERACRDLETVHAKNAATRKEIENLRDQLFSGSSIKESRRAIEQGDNIKVLTLGSMVFLPLTFVTVSRNPPYLLPLFNVLILKHQNSAVSLWDNRVYNLTRRLEIPRDNGLRLRTLHRCPHPSADARGVLARAAHVRHARLAVSAVYGRRCR